MERMQHFSYGTLGHICDTRKNGWHQNSDQVQMYSWIFMSFLHKCAVGSEYLHDRVHAIEVLAAVNPNDVLRYSNL
jgi:hypothetical protein